MTFEALTDQELEWMRDRAWREAALAWSEARAATGPERAMLFAAAESAEAWWRELRDGLATRQNRHILEEVPA